MLQDLASQQETLLPRLRQELNIYKAGSFPDGASSWIIHDGVTNRYYRIGERTFKLLSIWTVCDLQTFADHASVQLQSPVQVSEVDELVKFLFTNNLTISGPQDSYETYLKQHQATRHGWFGTLVHNYLFFKIPLFRPQRFINAGWHFVAPFFTRGFAIALVCIALIALFLVSRQWETFTATFFSFLTFDGLFLYLISLVFLKVCHELGHAFMAKKYDVEVPTIGVAFLVLFPVLYTDTSAAAKLKEQREKLLIDCGGILVELALAVVATLFWIFLPDGPMRAIAFTTATLSWLLSLAVNLNPLMRFDGYYVFSDLLGVENLQNRSFEMAKWKLREFLFKPGMVQPEIVSDNMRVVMIFYAWATWVYRFLLFLGIALLVYHFFIKVIGIVLFAIEIIWFILLPIWREVKVWWQQRETFKTPRFGITSFIFVGLFVLSALPISTQVPVAAVVKAKSQIRLYPIEASKIVYLDMVQDKLIKKGYLLAELTSPVLSSEIALSQRRLNLLEIQMQRATTNAVDLSSMAILRQQKASEQERLTGMLQKREQLKIRAPFDGYLENVDPELHVGQWIGTSKSVALFRSANGSRLLGVVAAEDMQRIKRGDGGVFIPDSKLLERQSVRLTSVAPIASQELEHDLLADVEGGIVPTIQHSDGTVDLQGSWFQVEMEFPVSASGQSSPTSEKRGVAILEGEARSPLLSGLKQVASVLIRESGF